MPPIRKSAILVVFTITLGLWLALCGALHSTDDVDAAPASHIFDDAILFQKADKDRLSLALTETANKISVSVYVAGYSFLEGEAARERAGTLCSRWLDGKPGLVIVYTRGSAQPAIAPSQGLWQRYPADEIVLLMQESGRLLGDVFLSPEQRVIRATNVALKKLNSMEAARLARLHHFSLPDTRLAVILGVLLLVAGVIFLVTIRLLRQRSPVREGPYYFPDAVVATRLGAQFGGGVTGEAGPGQKL